MDVSSETSTPRAPVPQLCPGLMSLQCGLPLEDWDDHPLCASCQALNDLPCRGLFACPVCTQWPEDKRRCFLATQSITAGQRGTSFLSLPPRPELTFVLFSALGRSGPATCPLSARTTAVHGVYRPAAFTTGHPVFCASPFGLPGVGSTQWGEKDSTLPPTAPAPAHGPAGPARHHSHSPLQADPKGSRSLSLHNPRGQAQRSHHDGHRCQEDTSTRKSPVSPRPRPLYYRYTRHHRHSQRSSPLPSSSGDRWRTGPYIYRHSPGRRHPISQYRSPQLPDGHQRRRRLHNKFACTETGNSHTSGQPSLPVSPHSYANHQQGDVTDATTLLG